MGFSDKLKKIVGLEDNYGDDDFTDEELEAAKEELRRADEAERAEKERAERAAREKAQVMSFTPKTEQQSKSEFVKAEPLRPEVRATMTGTNTLKLVVIEPKDFNECPKLVNNLKGRRPVIINLENVETVTANKIFDFLSGATYALNGKVEMIANNIFIFAPENVAIDANAERTVDYAKSNNPWRD